MGLTDGTYKTGVQVGSTGALQASVEMYGVNIGTWGGPSLTNAKTYGIVSDVSKSGIIVEPDTQISMIIKY